MTDSVQTWVESELAAVSLGDARLDRRFRSLVHDLSRHCGKTLASSFGTLAELKGAYRFFANDRVEEQAMLAPHIEQSVRRVREHHTVLVLQDSTYLDYSSREKTTGLNALHARKSGKSTKGLLLHNTLAVTCEGLPLGLLDQRFVDRQPFRRGETQDGPAPRLSRLTIKDKESARWIEVLEAVRALDTGETRTVHVADRECDFYEFFRDARDLGQNLLIRAVSNRAIDKRTRGGSADGRLFDKLAERPSEGNTTVTVQINGTKKYRQATLSIMRMAFSMPAPQNKTVPKDGANLPMVPLTAVMAVEEEPPEGETALRWVLLTNLAVEDFDQAIEKVQWYSRRWNIEVFHKVLKSGCGVEIAQLGSAERLRKYIVLESIVAWRLFWLTRLSEHDGNAGCETILSEEEWSLLYRKTHRTREVPVTSPSLADATVWIAKLGGYLDRTSDPPPGVTSLWRGWQRLTDMLEDQRDLCG